MACVSQLGAIALERLNEVGHSISPLLNKKYQWDLVNKINIQPQNALTGRCSFSELGLKPLRAEKIKKLLSRPLANLWNNGNRKLSQKTHRLPVPVFLSIMERRCKGKEY